ncbi:MAG: hypothetical protein HUU22_14420, partial [Phycisphaerae bacterium]|nr:hypothetical protein [Phycisphaerae bacterium]
QPLTAAPYAHFSTKPWATSGNDISYTTGNVGIGTSDPQRKLDVLAGVNTSLRVGRDGGTNLELKHFNTALTDVPGSAFGMQAIGPLHSHVVLDVQANDNEDGFYVRVPTTMQMNPTVDKTVLAVKGNGRVGIGTVSPSDPLTVNGAIRSVSGGFKYPDGSVQTTAASALAANTRTPQQISLLRWYDAIQTGQTFAVGSNPYGVAFDGANIWVTNSGSSNVTKLRASDGAYLGTFAVGSTPLGVAFDGANIWVANYFSNNVTKLRASDGAYLGTFAVGLQTSGVAFDGANIWVTNSDSGTVSKL